MVHPSVPGCPRNQHASAWLLLRHELLWGRCACHHPHASPVTSSASSSIRLRPRRVAAARRPLKACAPHTILGTGAAYLPHLPAISLPAPTRSQEVCLSPVSPQRSQHALLGSSPPYQAAASGCMLLPPSAWAAVHIGPPMLCSDPWQLHILPGCPLQPLSCHHTTQPPTQDCT